MEYTAQTYYNAEDELLIQMCSIDGFFYDLGIAYDEKNLTKYYSLSYTNYALIRIEFNDRYRLAFTKGISFTESHLRNWYNTTTER